MEDISYGDLNLSFSADLGYSVSSLNFRGNEFLDTSSPSRYFRWGAVINQQELSQTGYTRNFSSGTEEEVGQTEIISAQNGEVVFRPAGLVRKPLVRVQITDSIVPNTIRYESQITLDIPTSGQNELGDSRNIRGSVRPSTNLPEATPHYLENAPYIYLDSTYTQVQYDLDISEGSNLARTFANETKAQSGGIVRHNGSGTLAIGFYSYDEHIYAQNIEFRHTRTRENEISLYFQAQDGVPQAAATHTRVVYITFGHTEEVYNQFVLLHNYFQLARRKSAVAYGNSRISGNLDAVSALN